MRLFIKGFGLLVALKLFFSCTSDEKIMNGVAVQSLHSFYNNNMVSFKSYLDSTGVHLFDYLINSDSLNFKNTYNVSLLSNQNDISNILQVKFLKIEASDSSLDTVRLNLSQKGNQYHISVDEATFLELLKNEPDICNEIAKKLLSKDEKQTAVKWFQQAAEKNDVEAKYYLGLLYRSNLDFNEAIKLFTDAYNNGYDKALIELTRSYSMSGNREKAVEILKSEAKKDNTEAMIALGHYYNTISPPDDATPNSAFNWYKMAAEKGNIKGMYSFGLLYETKSNYDSAFYWYTKAASLGENLSMSRLGDFYIEGIYVEKDFDKGWHWLEEAAKINKGLGYNDMADIYRYGKGVKVNKIKALEYYKKAAKEGLKVAEINVQELEKELNNKD